MSAISIYDPRIKAYAERHGVSDLQAYRALNARAQLIARREAGQLRATYK